MLQLIARRFVFALVTLWAVSVVVFTAVELLPGDACQAFLGQMAQGQRLDNCRSRYQLDQPAQVRYLKWAKGLLAGGLGQRIKRDKNKAMRLETDSAVRQGLAEHGLLSFGNGIPLEV